MRKGKYLIKEIFYSIQGEGFHSGKPAIFIRFSGCNLWSGKEIDRRKAICKFCDTDFVGTDGENGGEYTSEELVDKLNSLTSEYGCKFVILTGGEPLLQVNSKLIDSFHENGYYIALESNGTFSVPQNIDWITISPKKDAKLVQKNGDELKIVLPQKQLNPKDYLRLDFKHFYLQPKEEKLANNNLNEVLDYCLRNPKWKISIQLHKILGIQ
jgi:7-carboxy-7-deazaguanine synthase (Cx14CxxC type)